MAEPVRSKVLPLTSQSIELVPKSTPLQLSFMGSNYEEVGKALGSVFGRFPLQLNKFEHEQVLLGMCAAGKCAAYEQLLEALRKYGEIEVRLG